MGGAGQCRDQSGICRGRGAGVSMALTLSAVVGAIGIGSNLFHTHAQIWALIAKSTPIGAFILIYLIAVNGDVWGMLVWMALGGARLLVPYTALTVAVWQGLPVLGILAGYMQAPVLIATYAALLWRRTPRLARGLLSGAALLLAYLTARRVDELLCPHWPVGKHFLWHILNAIMLVWMIELFRHYVSAT